jgi:DNA invertase Pin-like site-specific DNA recombinase
MKRKVVVIPSSIDPATLQPKEEKRKKRVAAYARVSTDSDEQFTSYEAQVDYYTQYIKNNEEWEFAGVYADGGISGTSTRHREQFNKMIQDALDGKIDLIVTKSVSRFARNTVDSLTTIRKLKEKGIEVYFQKENIYTLDSAGELLLTLMSSLAQEESRSISENVTWGKRKQFADGKVSLPYGRFLGYRRGADGLPEVVPEEAEIVRWIYRSFINGLTPNHIAEKLMERGIPSPSGKPKWYPSVIESILTNEKYKGSALLQKKFTVDFLTKKVKVNEGEVPQYYIEESHEAIIEPEEFELVQAEYERRKALGKQYHSKSLFAARIVCADCGGYFGSKVWHSNSKYRKTVWHCNQRKEKKCSTPIIREEDIKNRFMIAFRRLSAQKDTVAETCREMIGSLTDCSAIDNELNSCMEEMSRISDLVRQFIAENSTKEQDQDSYMERYLEMAGQYEKLKSKADELQNERNARTSQADLLSGFLREFEKAEMTEFDEHLWAVLIDTVTVQQDGSFCFRFKSGDEVNI